MDGKQVKYHSFYEQFLSILKSFIATENTTEVQRDKKNILYFLCSL
jgi:hypothetical protein